MALLPQKRHHRALEKAPPILKRPLINNVLETRSDKCSGAFPGQVEPPAPPLPGYCRDIWSHMMWLECERTIVLGAVMSDAAGQS